MGEPAVADRKRFGRYLRRVREDRRLSLDAVEELTVGYPDPVTKSHLSRIENGSAVPSFGKMFALSQVYGVPIAALSERFEVELLRVLAPGGTVPETPGAVMAQLDRLRLAGDYVTGIALLAAARERFAEPDSIEVHLANDLRLYEVNFLVHLERYGLAKDRAEQLLSRGDLDTEQRLLALMGFATCCYRLKRFPMAELALAEVGRELGSRDDLRKLEATFTSLRAGVLTALGLHERAIETYERAVELHRAAQESFEACRAQVNLGQALIEAGRIDESSAQLESALRFAEEAGYDRFRALALSHLALVAFRRGDFPAAETHALRSNAIARPREYLTVVFRNCFYLRAVALARDDTAVVVQNERTLRTYLNRVDPDLPEAVEFRAELAGGGR